MHLFLCHHFDGVSGCFMQFRLFVPQKGYPANLLFNPKHKRVHIITLYSRHRVFRITAFGLIYLSQINFAFLVMQERKISNSKKPQLRSLNLRSGSVLVFAVL